MTLQELLDEHTTITQRTTRLQSSIDRWRSTEKDAAAEVVQLRQEHRPFDLMGPAHHKKIEDQFTAEWKPRREVVAGSARFGLEPRIQKFEGALRSFIAGRKGDAQLTLPDALDHVGPEGMIALALLRETRWQRLQQMSADDLLKIYRSALDRRDAPALADLELVEERVERGGLAKLEQDLPIVRELTDLVEGIRELRVPTELIGIEADIEAARKAITQADRAGIRPVNIDHDPNARAVVGQEAAEAVEA